MCKKKQFKYCPSKIDECMHYLIVELNLRGIKTYACCCGHGKYPLTIVVKCGFGFYDLVSGESIPRKKRFYKKDKQGYYYIPETIKKKEGVFN